MSSLGEVAPRDCSLERSLSSDLYWSQTSRIDGGTESSQPTFNSHNRCRRIFVLKVEGENHPSTLNVFAISETSRRLVIALRGGNSATVKQKWSMAAFHSIPSVFVYSLGSGITCMDLESPRSEERCCRVAGSLEVHLWSKKPARENRFCSCTCNSIASWTKSAPVKPSST